MKLKSHICLFFLIVANAAGAALPSLERIEPSNWWVGMKNPELQLMVHGNNISQRSVSFSYAGVELVKVSKVENANFLFLDLKISSSAKPGKFEIVFKSPKEKDLHFVYELRERAKAVGRNQGVTSRDLIYLVMPDRFSNGDPKNDIVSSMKDQTLNRDSMYYRHGGDLQGIIDHLDYLRDLGITTIWNTPEIENDQRHASYHGYAVTDHYKIDPRYGTNELYKTFVEKCHEKNIKVIKDIVHNHIGSEHWLMKDMPSKDWVHQWDSYTQTTYKDQPSMDPYVAQVDKKIAVDGWFVRSMPDLNQSNSYVQNYLTQNHIWWIEYAGIDGLRLDTYLYNDPEYMAKWAKQVKDEFPSLGIFGETLVNSVVSQAYFTEANPLRKEFNTELPGITDVQVKDAIYEAVNGKFGWMDGVTRLYSVLSCDIVYKDPAKNVIFMDNHDMSRFYSCVNEDFGKYKSALALLLTTRGIPQLYYGTEILMKNFSNPDGKVREDFKGGWQGDAQNKFTAEGRSEIENTSYNYLKKLANYRKLTPALQTGKLMQYVPENGVYVYFRYDADKTVMIVFNSDEKEKDVTTQRFNERTAGFKKGINIINDELVADLGTLKVPAKTVFIYELQK